MKRLEFAVFLLAQLLAVNVCYSKDTCLQPPSPAAANVVLQELRVRRTVTNCYDIQAHTPTTWTSVTELLNAESTAKAPAEKSKAVADILAKLLEVMKAEVHSTKRSKQLIGKLSEARAAIENESRESTGNLLDITSWRITEATRNGYTAVISEVFPNTDFDASIRNDCNAATPPATCAAAIEDFESTVRAHAAVELALGTLHAEDLAHYKALFETRHNMWEAYRTQARPQYPWEWLLNGALYTDTRSRDAAGNPRGPANLPKGQVVLLHPGVGLERFDPKTSFPTQNNPTLFIEWLGYNRLNWDYGTGRLTGGLGVSVISAYAARTHASDWSNGLMFTLQNKYGVAVTRNSGGSSIMLSVDLSELFRDKLDAVGQRLGPNPDTY